MRSPISLLALVLCALLLPAMTDSQQLGIRGHAAPDWTIDRWLNLPAGIDALSPVDFRGRVVYLFFFQSWCPGCHSHGFPTLRATYDRYLENEEVVFIAVQTTFEGHSTNTAAKALQSVGDYSLEIPVGHAEGGDGGGLPELMRTYRTGGTPWTVIIDRQGVVRFNGFSLEPEAAERMIEQLLAP